MWQDLVYSIRTSLRNLSTTLLIVLTLSLGIGASAAMVSVVNSVLIRPLPFNESNRIVGLRETLPDEGRIPMSYRTFAEWRDRNSVFESIAAASERNFNLEMGDPVRVPGMYVTQSYFAVMGMQPLLGRTFLPEEMVSGTRPLVVVGYDVWQKHFGGDPNIVGKTIKLDGANYTVLGVMPAGLDLAEIGWTSLWVPFITDDQKARQNPGRYLRVNARLKPGVPIEQARQDLDGIMKTIRNDFPETHGKPYGVDVRPLQEFVVSRDVRLALIVLLGIVGCVLLIACANVANLMLVRATVRERDIAIRTALGASRWRVVRQLLAESALLSLLGAAGGLLLAKLGIKVLLLLKPDSLPRLETVAIDKTVLAVTIAVTVVVALVIGLAPVVLANKLDVYGILKDGGRGGTARRHNRLRALLVVSEVALALMLLIGAGLMIRTYVRLRNIELGFNPEKVITMEINLPARRYREPAKKVAFYRDVVNRLKSVPGVEAVSAAQAPPLRGPTYTDPVYFEGQPAPPPGQEPYIRGNIVTPDFFQVLGIPLRGRPFTEQETWETGGAVIVNEAFAQRFFPGTDPLGKRIKIRSDQPWLTIVGVSKNVLQDVSNAKVFEEIINPYLDPTDPYPVMTMSLVVRTKVDPASVFPAIREEVRRIDPELPLSRVLTMREIVDGVSAAPRFNMFLFSLFGAVALILATVGIYGVISQMVTQQTHQIGIRMALGAGSGDIMRLVLRRGMLMTLLGVLIGLAGSFALSRLLASLLYGVVHTTDLVTFGGFSLILVATAFFACYLPARRAIGIEPMNALRQE